MPLIADEIKALVERVYNEERVLVHGVNWDFYEAVLEEVGNRPIRVTYNEGELEIMPPPSGEHEDDANYISDLLKAACNEFKIDYRSQRTRTWRRKDLDCGLEADECFYIQNYDRVARGKSINLPAEPPPDIAIEIDISRSSTKKHEIYAKLQVPELWRRYKGHLTFFALKDGKYEMIEESLAFPGLTARDIERFVKSFYELRTLEALEAFRKWVRKNLKKPAERRAK